MSADADTIFPENRRQYESNRRIKRKSYQRRTADQTGSHSLIKRSLIRPIPDGSIRLAGGRGLLKDKGLACFQSGANAAISGDMLTTAGITTKTDLGMLHNLGYKVRLIETA